MTIILSTFLSFLKHSVWLKSIFMVSMLRLVSCEFSLNRASAISEKSTDVTLKPFLERNTELRPVPQAISSTDPGLNLETWSIKKGSGCSGWFDGDLYRSFQDFLRLLLFVISNFYSIYRLQLSVSERSPQPLHRSEIVSRHPPPTAKNLDWENH